MAKIVFIRQRKPGTTRDECLGYTRDAKGRCDDEVAEFFAEVQQQHARIAERAKALLEPRLR